jgi:hypothetical protein
MACYGDSFTFFTFFIFYIISWLQYNISFNKSLNPTKPWKRGVLGAKEELLQMKEEGRFFSI